MRMIYNTSKDEILETNKETMNGLNKENIKQQREQFGANKLEEEKPKSIVRVFLSQFADLLVVILIISALISFFTGHVESTGVIIGVIIVNAILGTVQHVKAEKSLKSLKALSAPMAKVIRGGKKEEILAEELVVSDLLLLEAGDIVSADGRILDNFSLQVNESSLTGESESVTKTDETMVGENIALGDQRNMVFSGSLVTYGRATVLVTAVGMGTELGKIANLMNMTVERKTPLQVSLDGFSKKLAIGVIAISILVFGLEFYRKTPPLDALMFAVALAVAAIPEALSSIVTIALAIGTTKMSKQNAIIKDLKAVEGLGSVSIICSDKTGTLTQNKMTVKKEYTLGDAKRLRLIAILCNDSFYANGEWVGDPTETALTSVYTKSEGQHQEVLAAYPRIKEIPFDSDRKLMSTLQKIENDYYLFTKGALDVLLERTSFIQKGDAIVPITEEDVEEILTVNHEMSNNGLRVLAFAQKKMDQEEASLSSEYEYTFVGLVAMIDPPREESKEAVADCIMAGIKPIMITGDHKITASAIAREIGILNEGEQAIEGIKLDEMEDQELMELLPKISVYARVSPEHKIRIVDLWQKKGFIVAMTGDGVNDAPALKKADIGIAMGITGTAVSKDAASVILTDDNFATIIRAVENGRNIYANIKNAIKFLLSGNISGIVAIMYTAVLALPIPFTAVHLLFINLLTDSLPAIAISMEKSRKDLLKDKPRDKSEGIITKNFLISIGIQGMIIAIFTIISYRTGLKLNKETASTMAFATLCLARLFHGFNLRGEKSIFTLGLGTNKYSLFAFCLGSFLLVSALFIPGLQTIFEVVALSGRNLMIVFFAAFSPTILIQTGKVISEVKSKRN